MRRSDLSLSRTTNPCYAMEKRLSIWGRTRGGLGGWAKLAYEGREERGVKGGYDEGWRGGVGIGVGVGGKLAERPTAGIGAGSRL